MQWKATIYISTEDKNTVSVWWNLNKAQAPCYKLFEANDSFVWRKRNTYALCIFKYGMLWSSLWDQWWHQIGFLMCQVEHIPCFTEYKVIKVCNDIWTRDTCNAMASYVDLPTRISAPTSVRNILICRFNSHKNIYSKIQKCGYVDYYFCGNYLIFLNWHIL